MSQSAAEFIISQVAQAHPHVLELAELLAPAVRAEGALLRRLRMELLPHHSAEVEAKLWFSPLVQAHSADGITLSVPVAVALRQRLAEQWQNDRRPLLERARAIYAEVHAYLPEPLRLEEEVAWSLIAADVDAAEKWLASALTAVLAEPDQFRFWAAQATARLPDGFGTVKNGVLLAGVARGAQLTREAWEAAYGTLSTKPLAVRHTGRQLELGGPVGPGSRRIDVPAAAEVRLWLHWALRNDTSSGDRSYPAESAGTENHTTVSVRDGAPSAWIPVSGHVEVRTAAGVTYVVRDDPFARPATIDPAADPRGELRSMLASRRVPGLRLADDGEAAEIGVALRDGLVTLVGPAGEPLPAVPQTDPAEGASLGNALTVAALAAHVSRWLTVAELRSGSPVLAGAIEVTTSSVGPAAGQHSDERPTELTGVRIANLSSEPLFVAVLALSPYWSVEVLAGGMGGSVLAPGEALSSQVLTPKQDKVVRFIGVAARQPFDPRPLELPAITPIYGIQLPVAAPPGPSPSLDTEIALMTGAPAGDSTDRYLDWTTSEAIVPVISPSASAGDEQRLVLAGHGGAVRAVVFSPDGTRLATGSDDGAARVFDAATGSELVRLNHDGQVFAVAFSPDGTRLATGSDDGAARVFDAATGSELARLHHAGSVHAVAFSPDGRLVASAGWDGTLRLWDTATATARAEMPGRLLLDGVAFSPDGRLVAAAGEGGMVRLLDTATAALRGEVWGRGVLHAVAFSPDGRLVAAASGNESLWVWDVAAAMARTDLQEREKDVPLTDLQNRGVLRAELQGHGVLHTVVFSPDGRTVAAAGADQTVWLWDSQTTELLSSMLLDQGVLYGVAFSPDGRLLATAGEDGTVQMRDAPGWAEPAPDGSIGTLTGRRILIVIAAKAPPGLAPLADLDANVDLLVSDLSSRSLDVMGSAASEAFTSTQVLSLMAELRRHAAEGDIADLLVLYVAAHSSLTPTGSPEVVLADGAPLDADQFAAVFGAARNSVVLLDTSRSAWTIGRLARAADDVTLPGRSIALISSSEVDPAPHVGGFVDAFVAALTRTRVVDRRLIDTVNERLAAGRADQRAELWSSGFPVSLPELETVPAGWEDLAEKLRARGDLAGARDVQLRSHETAVRVLGKDHPDTLRLARGLASGLRALGDIQAARVLDEDTLDRSRRVLGEDHPDTLQVASNLGFDLRELGEVHAARELEEGMARRSGRLQDGDGDDGGRWE